MFVVLSVVLWRTNQPILRFIGAVDPQFVVNWEHFVLTLYLCLLDRVFADFVE